MHEGEFWERYELSRMKLLQAVRACMNEGVVFVVERDGQIVASTGILVDSPWFSDDITLVQLWIFVRKGHRKSTFAEQMIRASKGFADSCGLDLHWAAVGLNQANRRNALFRRHMTAAGESFLHLVDREGLQ